MKTIYLSKLVIIGLLLLSHSAIAQQQATADARIYQEKLTEKPNMKTYLIEREIPNAGELTADQLQG
ncbi:MAG: hypothetical protein KJN76_03645, partial [Eudoraea sp.]|nr:hypothetical protein [Eudoraea sp.]